MGRHESETSLVVPVVLPIHKSRIPVAGHLVAGEWPIGVAEPVDDDSEQKF